MEYSIRESEAFSVIGQETELTDFQKKNIQISTQFWQTFNANLKKAYLSQYANWVKYAFTERKNGKLFYYYAIPQRAVIPENFVFKKIESHRYLVVEHIGSMDRIYTAYSKLYKEILPHTGYVPIQGDFLHFERYDYRFNWNRENSIIEIWLPIEG